MLRLPKALAAEILAHARADQPAEACGLIAGQAGKAKRLYRIPSDDPSPTSYYMNPQALFNAMQEMEENGQDLLAIYHSHPTSPAYPSATDIQLAFYPESFYLIVSLQVAQHPEVRAFQIQDGAVAEVSLVTTS